MEKLLKTKIFEWVEKTFGKPQHGDRVELTDHVTEKEDKQVGLKFRITEIGFIVQRRGYEEKEVNEAKIKKWKEELDEISGNSIIMFHCGDEKMMACNKETNWLFEEMRSLLLSVKIFKKEQSGVSLIIPKGGVPH